MAVTLLEGVAATMGEPLVVVVELCWLAVLLLTLGVPPLGTDIVVVVPELDVMFEH